MRIALLAPPWYSVPPRAYGGTEALVAGLADGLHARGHDVLVVAAGPSSTRAPSVATLDSAAEMRLGDESTAALHASLAQEIVADFAPDVVHDHTVLGPSYADTRRCPTVVTVHGRIGGDYGVLVRRQSAAVHLVAISDAHRASAPDLPWAATVRNGIPTSAFPVRRDKDDVLVFVGRMDPDKGVEQAIDVAERAGVPLLIAARLHGSAEEEFFATRIRPRLSSTVEYVGELGFADKTALMGSARALLFPLQWEEPYGLVVAEAQACGTPVLSLRRGAVPELVVEGRTALLGDHHDELVPFVDAVRGLSPDDCRAHAERALDVSSTVEGYERVYADVAARQPRGRTAVINLRQPAHPAVPRDLPVPTRGAALAAAVPPYDLRKDLPS